MRAHCVGLDRVFPRSTLDYGLIIALSAVERLRQRADKVAERLAAEKGAGVRIASSETLLLRFVASREMSPLLISTGGHHGHAAHPYGTDSTGALAATPLPGGFEQSKEADPARVHRSSPSAATNRSTRSICSMQQTRPPRLDVVGYAPQFMTMPPNRR
jgi:hypothetical protein